MNIGSKIVLALVFSVGLLGAYWFGVEAGRETGAEVRATVVTAENAERASSQLAPTTEAPGPTLHPHPDVGREEAHGAPATPRGGRRFAQFRVGNSNVKALLADGHLLWVGTSGGVIQYDIEKDTHRLFDVRAGLLSNGIFHLSKLGDRLVVGTYGGGLSLFEPESEHWDHYNIQHGLADAFVYDVLQMANGDLWIATWSGANLVRGGRLDDPGSWSTFTVANTGGGLPNDWVYGLERAADGGVWMATEGGLAHYREGAWRNWKHQDGLGAAYELVREQIQFERDPAKESSHHARQKIEMGLGEVDVAYNPNYIVALYEDEKGIVWAGTWGGGLARFDGKEWRNFTVADGLPANHVFLIASAGDGEMWVGTSGGLARFDGERFPEVLTTHDGLYANNIFSLARSAEGSLWVGSYGGVARLKKGS